MRETHFSIEVTSEAVNPVVSTAEARAHVQQNHTDDDTYLDALVKAATIQAKKITGLSLITESLTIRFDRFPGRIVKLPAGPIQTFSSIAYLDGAGVSQTLSASLYATDLYSKIPRVFPAASQNWPGTQCMPNAVTMAVIAGYGDDGEDVPEGIRHAIKLMVGHWYRNRESVVPGQMYEMPQAVETLLFAERGWWL